MKLFVKIIVIVKSEFTLIKLPKCHSRESGNPFFAVSSLKDITERIISCAIEVHSTLGPGLLENVYEEVLLHEFKLRDIVYEHQKEITLKYKGKVVFLLTH